MKSWKKVAVVGTAFVAAAVLAACSSGNSNGSNSGSVKGQTLTIGYWKGSDTENATFDKLVKAFESKYSVTVKPKVYTDITTQLPTDLTAGTAPDAFYIDSAFYPYLQSQGVLVPLDSVVKSSDFYSTLAKTFTTDGKLYAAPKDISTLAIYVNKDIFTKAGIDESSIPKSWEDFITWAPTAQAKLDAAYGAGKVKLINVNADLNRNWQFVTAEGKNPVTSEGKSNLSDSTIVNNLNTVVKLFNTGAVATPADMGVGDEGAGFGGGKFAMALTGNWNYAVFQNQYNLKPSTNFDIIQNLTYKDKAMTMLYTVGWGENKATKVSTLANDWISYVTGKEAMTTWTTGVGTLATRPDVADGSAFLKANPLLQVHQDGIKIGVPWQDGVNIPTIATSYGNFITSAFKKGATIDDLKTALSKADQDANSKLSK